MTYQIIKVNKFFARGARVTSERTLRTDATLDEVLAIAARQGADLDETVEELNDYGYTSFKGYMVFEF